MSACPDQRTSIIEQIKKSPSFIIVIHENPDGDAIDSQLALAFGLRSLDKQVQVVSKDPIPKMYDFLPGKELSITSDEAKIEPEEILVALDCGDLERTGLTFVPQKPPIIINIDHHVSNTQFGHLNWVDTSVSSTSEIIFLLMNLLGLNPSPPIAINLYTGILTDTGSALFCE